jgi:hypothetical protein
MAKQYSSIQDQHRDFILKQKMCFTASAASNCEWSFTERLGYISIYKSERWPIWRLTLMFCAYEEPPLILRLYGHGTVVSPSSTDYSEMFKLISYNLLWIWCPFLRISGTKKDSH